MESEKKISKIFDDFPTVDCNDCQHYWLDRCDGAKPQAGTRCREFNAVRGIDIPLQIKSIKTASMTLKKVLVAVCISNVLQWLVIVCLVIKIVRLA